MDLAVGVIIGAAFGKIVDSAVKDLIMPVVGAVIGKIDFSSLYIKLAVAPAGVPDTLEALQKAGVPVFAYGNFITIVVNFLILAFVVFMLVKQFNRMKKEPPAELPATPEEIVLLRKIRDNLKKQLFCCGLLTRHAAACNKKTASSGFLLDLFAV